MAEFRMVLVSKRIWSAFRWLDFECQVNGREKLDDGSRKNWMDLHSQWISQTADTKRQRYGQMKFKTFSETKEEGGLWSKSCTDWHAYLVKWTTRNYLLWKFPKPPSNTLGTMLYRPSDNKWTVETPSCLTIRIRGPLQRTKWQTPTCHLIKFSFRPTVSLVVLQTLRPLTSISNLLDEIQDRRRMHSFFFQRLCLRPLCHLYECASFSSLSQWVFGMEVKYANLCFWANETTGLEPSSAKWSKVVRSLFDCDSTNSEYIDFLAHIELSRQLWSIFAREYEIIAVVRSQAVGIFFANQLFTYTKTFQNSYVSTTPSFTVQNPEFVGTSPSFIFFKSFLMALPCLLSL